MRSRVYPVLLLAVGGLGGWLASESRAPRLLADEPPAVTPAPASDPKVEEPAAKAEEPAAVAENPLETLDWLVGDWVDADENFNVDFSCHFTKNRSFLVRSFRVLDGETVKLSGMQVIGYDAALGTIRSWTFDSHGGFGEEIWTQTGTRYTLRSTYTLPDGTKGSALSTLTYVDDNTCTWKSVCRELGGEFISDVDEFTIVRAPQAEEPKEVAPEAPKKEGN